MKVGCYRIHLKNYSLFIPIVFTAILIYCMVDNWSIINTDAMLTIKTVAILMVLSLAFILKEEVVIQKADDNLPEEKESFLSTTENYIKFIGFVLLFFLYIFAFTYVGFFIATLVFLVAAMYFLSVRSIKILLLVPTLLTASIYIVFKMILMISLPTGVLGM